VSTSTDGILAYGYDLGGDEGIKVVEGGKYGDIDELDIPEVDDEHEYYGGLADRLLLKLYRAIPDAPPVEYGWHNLTQAHYGVTLAHHCSADYADWILATVDFSASRGRPETIPIAELEARRVAEDWDGKLAHALSVLGLTPTQEKPAWLLASYWG
jgi:hypothetical protein